MKSSTAPSSDREPSELVDASAPRGTDFPERLIRHATLRQLQVFEAIARHGSFTRAAEALCLGQSTVSMQIRKLGETIGQPLFEQVGRKVYPTDAGRAVHEACLEIFRSLGNLETRLSDLQGMRRGRLRVSAITTAKYFLPRILGEFMRAYPGIEVAFKVTNRERVLRRLEDNEDDLFVIGNTAAGRYEIECVPFAPNPLVVVVDRDHPMVGRTHVPLAELAHEPFLLREPGSGIRDSTLRLFAKHDLVPNVRMELSSNEAIKHSIAAQMGISVMSLHSFILEGVEGELRVLPVEGFPIHRTWHLAYPRGKSLSLVARGFLEFAVTQTDHIAHQLRELLPGLELPECWHRPQRPTKAPPEDVPL